MVDIGEREGRHRPKTRSEMIENVFEFNNRTAEDVMTHRTDVTRPCRCDTTDEETIIAYHPATSGLSPLPGL